MNFITGYYPRFGNVFSRNPFVVEVNAPTLVIYTVEVDGETVFTGNGIGKFSLNLSDIMDAVFLETEPPTGTGLFLQYPTSTNDFQFTLTMSDEYGVTDTLSGRAWKGGINRRDYRMLRSAGTDVFKEKLTNYSGNFFFTTRTYGWTITVKETEIEPLPFIMPLRNGDEMGYIVVREKLTGETLSVYGTPGVLGALNIDAVRKHFFSNHGILANAFDILDVSHPSRVACRIIIERAQEAVERCAVRFLNSFGVYERIDLVGEVTMQTVASQDENKGYQTLDINTDSFVKARSRTLIGYSYKVTTGIKRGDELAFLQDMLASDSVYLILPDQELKVIPTVSSSSRAYNQRTPESMDITFQPVEEEKNFTPYRSAYGSVKPRIFTTTFSEQFN